MRAFFLSDAEVAHIEDLRRLDAELVSTLFSATASLARKREAERRLVPADVPALSGANVVALKQKRG